VVFVLGLERRQSRVISDGLVSPVLIKLTGKAGVSRKLTRELRLVKRVSLL